MAIDKQAKDIFKELKGIEELLKEDLDSWDPRTLPGKRMQHAQARARRIELQKEYEKFVLNNAAAIYVDGGLVEVANFAKLAEETGKTLTIDARGLYVVLAETVFDSLKRNQVDFAHVGILTNELVYWAEVTGYLAPLNVRFTKLLDRPFTTKAELVDAIRSLVQADVGDLLQIGYMQKIIVDRAFASGATNSPVPYVILNAGEDDKAVLNSFVFGASSVNVTVEGEVVPYTVTKAFNELKKKLKSNTNTTEVSN